MLNERSASMYVCVFTSWTIFCRCFCLRCWHSNTSYTWNTTPAYKTHYYPTWGGILAGVCSALLSIRTLASRRHRWPTRMLRLHHCLSLSNTAVCLVLSLYLSAPPIARDIYFIYIFPMQRVREKASLHTPQPQSWSLKEIIDQYWTLPPSPPPLVLHYSPGSDPQLVILLVLHRFGM